MSCSLSERINPLWIHTVWIKSIQFSSLPPFLLVYLSNNRNLHIQFDFISKQILEVPYSVSHLLGFVGNGHVVNISTNAPFPLSAKKRQMKNVLDSKRSLCSECCMLSFGRFPGVWILYFILYSILYNKMRRWGITQKKAYKKLQFSRKYINPRKAKLD